MEHFFGRHQCLSWGEYTRFHISPRKHTQHQESGTIHNPVYSGHKDSLLWALLFSFLNKLCEGGVSSSVAFTLCLPYLLTVASLGILHFRQCIASKPFPSSIENGEIIKQGLPGTPTSTRGPLLRVPFNTVEPSALLKPSSSLHPFPPLPLLQHGLRQPRQPSSPLSQKRFVSLSSCGCVPPRLQTTCWR